MATLLSSNRKNILRRVAAEHGTPCFVYFTDSAHERLRVLNDLFGKRFTASYALKCNPNRALLRNLRSSLSHIDASSAGEIARAIDAGFHPDCITFSGPAKRDFELRYAVQAGCGVFVCESREQLDALNHISRESGVQTSVLIRISPRTVPKKFGLHMAGRPTQFGIDEEDVDTVLSELPSWHSLRLRGFHIFSGANCLDADAIAENFNIFIKIFSEVAHRHSIRPDTLVFGSGFGIPYFEGDVPLDLNRLAGLINTRIDQMRSDPFLANARCILEMGRWLVGEGGYMLTSVVATKHSRGTDIRMCDAGFNNHLNACGMMGSVIRRDWPFVNLSSDAQSAHYTYLLVGPLCATFDVLSSRANLPETRVGDVLAVGASGAYGLTASPTRFISHPEPRELLVSGEGEDVLIEDVTETALHTVGEFMHSHREAHTDVRGK